MNSNVKKLKKVISKTILTTSVRSLSIAGFALVLALFVVVTNGARASAADCSTNPNASGCVQGGLQPTQPTQANCTTSDGKPGLATSFGLGGTKCLALGDGSLQTNPIYVVLLYIFRFLSGIVGLAVVGGIVWGGITFGTARGNSSQTQKGVTIIVNAVIGLLLYILFAAIINFVIPGGIFSFGTLPIHNLLQEML